MNEQEEAFNKIISLFDSINCLNDVVVIGSWAEFLYQNTGLVPKGTIALKTLDIDFLIKNLKKPNPPINIENVAKKYGYTVNKDRLLNTTKLYSLSGIEIEFLISHKGSGSQFSYKTNLGVTAQGLRHLEILTNNLTDVHFNNIKIIVPKPEAYILHKIIINDDRVPEKKEKDINSITKLLSYINKQTLNQIIETLSKKEQSKVNEFLRLTENKN